MNQIKGATLVHAPRLRLSHPSPAHEGPGFCGRKRAFWYFRQDARLVCSLQCRLLLTVDFLTLEYLPQVRLIRFREKAETSGISRPENLEIQFTEKKRKKRCLFPKKAPPRAAAERVTTAATPRAPATTRCARSAARWGPRERGAPPTCLVYTRRPVIQIKGSSGTHKL